MAGPGITSINFTTNVQVGPAGGTVGLTVGTTDDAGATIQSIRAVFDKTLGVVGLQEQPSEYPTPPVTSNVTVQVGSVDLIDQTPAYLDYGASLPAHLDADGNFTFSHSGSSYGVTVPLVADDTGRYSLRALIITDSNGASATYAGTQLAALGTPYFDATVDSTKPTLTSFQLPDTIQLGDSGYIFTKAGDAGTGVKQVTVLLDEPLADGSTQLILVDHQSTDTSTYVGYAKPGQLGTYHIKEVDVTDYAGNVQAYDPAALTALGAHTSFTVTDTYAPALTSLTLPTTVDLSRGAASVNIPVGIYELGSGIVSASITFDRPIEQDYPGRSYGRGLVVDPFTITSNVVSGAAPSEYTYFTKGLPLLSAASQTNTGFTFSLGTHTASGSYSIETITLTDRSGNSATYYASDLAARNIATSFSVVGAPAANDFDANGHSDILWRNANGQISTWSATGSGASDGIVQSTYNGSVDTSWQIVGTFDWNGDGKSDLVWRNQDGRLSLWTGQGSSFTQSAYNDSATLDWHVAAAGDISGDGKDDLVWQNQDGSIATWLSTGTGFTHNALYAASLVAGYKVEGLGDFNGDGKADLLLRSANGALSVWNADGAGGFAQNSFTRSLVDPAWHVAGIGDFNGDGYDDLVWRNSDGHISIWQGSKTGLIDGTSVIDAPVDWSIAQVGDFNGDGLADLLWRNGSGALSIWHSTGSGWQQNTYYDASVGNDWSVVSHGFPL